MKKIYVLGNGLLGNYVYSYLSKRGKSVEQVTRKQLDFSIIDLSEFIDNNMFDEYSVIVNCIGVLKPNIDKVGLDVTVKINKNLPIALSNIASLKNIDVINISSDCVFSGKKGNYTENDFCDATDYYGLTKSLDSVNTTVIRTSFIGHEINNKMGILEFALRNSGNKVSGYTNCIWNGITALELADWINHIIDTDSYWCGVQHIYSKSKISKYDLLHLINEVYELNLKIIPVLAEEIVGTKIEGILDRSLSSIFRAPVNSSIEEQLILLKSYTL
jgi:dTDP-4-dehydrorhamnose reductase